MKDKAQLVAVVVLLLGLATIFYDGSLEIEVRPDGGAIKVVGRSDSTPRLPPSD